MLIELESRVALRSWIQKDRTALILENIYREIAHYFDIISMFLYDCVMGEMNSILSFPLTPYQTLPNKSKGTIYLTNQIGENDQDTDETSE